MHFCTKCNNIMSIREEIVQGTRKLFHFCKNGECNHKEECNTFRVAFKSYRYKMMDRKYLNRHKAKDITLPIMKSKCQKCGKVNENRYERKYFKNKFFINNICSDCHSSW